ncbi:hypothetical protein M405DRAFT_866580, partial [Rhizopogon salebrosus TDB-379]
MIEVMMKELDLQEESLVKDNDHVTNKKRGRGRPKGVCNSITVIPPPSPIKSERQLRSKTKSNQVHEQFLQGSNISQSSLIPVVHSEEKCNAKAVNLSAPSTPDSLPVQPAIKLPKEKNVPAGILTLVESTHSSRHYDVMPEKSSINDPISMRKPDKPGNSVLARCPTPDQYDATPGFSAHIPELSYSEPIFTSPAAVDTSSCIEAFDYSSSQSPLITKSSKLLPESTQAGHSQAAKSFSNLPKTFGPGVLSAAPTPVEWQGYKSSDVNQAPPASSSVTASQSPSKVGHNTFMDPDTDTPIVFETSK